MRTEVKIQTVAERYPDSDFGIYARARVLRVENFRRTTKSGAEVRVKIEVREGFQKFWGFSANRTNVNLIADGYADSPSRPDWGVFILPAENLK